MRKFVKQIAKTYASDEAAGQEFMKFYRLRQDPGWAVFVKMIHITYGLMAEHMFSSRFTELDREEKDIRQRTYAGIREFLQFLENPTLELQRALFVEGHEKTVKKMMQQRNQKQSEPAGRR